MSPFYTLGIFFVITIVVACAMYLIDNRGVDIFIEGGVGAGCYSLDIYEKTN